MENFKSGEKVVPLELLLASTAIVGFLVSSILAVFVGNLEFTGSILPVLIGAAGVKFVSVAISKMLYPTNDENVVVVRAEKESLPLSLRASIVGAVIGAIGTVSVLAFMGEVSLLASTSIPTLVIYSVSVLIWGYLSVIV